MRGLEDGVARGVELFGAGGVDLVERVEPGLDRQRDLERVAAQLVGSLFTLQLTRQLQDGRGVGGVALEVGGDLAEQLLLLGRLHVLGVGGVVLDDRVP
ncbi:hypothetical protein D3C86_1963150 [compost metagenome]